MRIKIKEALIKSIYCSSYTFIILRMIKLWLDIPMISILYNLAVTFSTICCLLYLLTVRKATIKIDLTIFMGLLILYEAYISVYRGTFYFPAVFNDILCWPLLIIVFKHYTENYSNMEFLKKSIVFLYFIIAILSIPLVLKHLSGYGNGGEVIFPTYFCITFMPLIYIYGKNNRIKIFCSLVSIIILIASTKRVGTLIVVFGSIFYLIANIHITKGLKKRMFKYLILFFSLFMTITFAYILVSNYNFKIVERFHALSDDGGSGREYIWQIVINSYKMSTLEEKVFGHGGQSVYYRLKPNNVSRLAHNSYIEYLYDYGIVGATSIIVFVLILFVHMIRLLKAKSALSPAFTYIMIVTLFLSSFSYYFDESLIIIPVAISIGCLLGSEKREGLI